MSGITKPIEDIFSLGTPQEETDFFAGNMQVIVRAEHAPAFDATLIVLDCNHAFFLSNHDDTNLSLVGAETPCLREHDENGKQLGYTWPIK